MSDARASSPGAIRLLYGMTVDYQILHTPGTEITSPASFEMQITVNGQVFTLRGDYHEQGFAGTNKHARIASISHPGGQISLLTDPIYATTGADILEPFMELARVKLEITGLSVRKDIDPTRDAGLNISPVPIWHFTVQQPISYVDEQGLLASFTMAESFE
ncbi:MAG: hypothetical protein JW839_09110 [Candidatus Lokiarchaeota archaeon]|nr:hypothetical protein [Candidatus Lokiarchaeota archaeon]